MRVIGLDFGMQCGYAFTDDDCPRGALSGEWTLHRSRTDGAGMPFARLEGKLRELIQKAPPAKPGEFGVVVFFEEAPAAMPASKGTQARVIFGGFFATVTGLCERLSVPYGGVLVSDVKRRAFGKGNASKEDVVHATRAIFAPEITDAEHNRADALWVLQCGLDDLCRDPEKRTIEGDVGGSGWDEFDFNQDRRKE